MKTLKFLIPSIAALFLLTDHASADLILSFEGLTSNNTADVTTGESQLRVVVADLGGGQVQFTFQNLGPAASSITDVYFDDGSLLGIASVINMTGVSFSQGASPPNLPSGENASPPFETSAGFLADSDPAAQPNGVNPGEQLRIVFDLQSGQSYSDVVSELESGELRIGIHVQGFTGGGSESFINFPPDEISGVPEPSSLLLLTIGAIGVPVLTRRRRQLKGKNVSA